MFVTRMRAMHASVQKATDPFLLAFRDPLSLSKHEDGQVLENRDLKCRHVTDPHPKLSRLALEPRRRHPQRRFVSLARSVAADACFECAEELVGITEAHDNCIWAQRAQQAAPGGSQVLASKGLCLECSI
jgi:hypothetical protein